MDQTLPELIAPQWADFPDIELYMDQVISVLEKHLDPYFPEEKCITSTMINNYVKQKLLPPPQNKRYSKGQLAKLFMICILKSFLQLSEISGLLENLEDALGEENLYRLFSQELDRALSCVFHGTQFSFPEEENSTEHALRAALVAFAAITDSRRAFRRAQLTWPQRNGDEEKKEKEKEKKKEKKEKKESKPKKEKQKQ